MERRVCRTVDESKAEPGQRVFVQIRVPVLPVPLVLKSPPAQHGSDKHQEVAVAVVAQILFHLDEQKPEDPAVTPPRCGSDVSF